MFEFTTLFCTIDDIIQKNEAIYWQYLKQENPKIRQRSGVLWLSEIIFIAVWYKKSQLHHFKAFYGMIQQFYLINAEGKAHLVKFHWTPKQGVAQVLWDEALKLNGKDPDFHRRDLWEAIENGNYPEWELGAQIFTEEEASEWDFDVLDPTKLVPEELVPVTPLGKFVLNRNTDDFFAETEQVAFSPANIVPGIDFSNDPLLQGRLFSYTDTHLHRLGTANFNQIPINKPVCPFHTNRRGGFANHEVYKGKANYEPNSVDDNWPREIEQKEDGFTSYPEHVEANKLRIRPESFADHFSQATLHYMSLEKHEQKHIKDAYAFELSKVQDEGIRQRVLDRILVNIAEDLATYVANELGLKPSVKPKIKQQSKVKTSEKLSIEAFLAPDIKQRKIAVLVHDGANATSVDAVKAWAESENAVAEVLAPSAAPVKSKDGKEIAVDGRQNGEPSVIYDAIVVIDGDNLEAFKADGVAKHYVLETYKHLKPIYLLGDKESLLEFFGIEKDDAIFHSKTFKDHQDKFKKAIQNHRLWSREDLVTSIPA